MSTTINNHTVSKTGIQGYVSHGYSILSVDRYCSITYTVCILQWPILTVKSEAVFGCNEP